MKNRRKFISESAYAMLGILPISNYLIAERTKDQFQVTSQLKVPAINKYYPTTDFESISSVVGASHANFDKVKELVTARPELAKATWDWGFGDVESALGAASHMGRKDIAEYLMEHGARPNIFTLAMLGKRQSVEAMIQELPDIQKSLGPHGFTLLHHAKIRLLRKNVEGPEKGQQEALVEYLESLGDAGLGQPRQTMNETEMEMYMGKYIFGDGLYDYFVVKKNMQGLLSLGRGEYFGRTLHKQENHIFSAGGAPSVRIQFNMENDQAKVVSIYNPGVILRAERSES